MGSVASTSGLGGFIWKTDALAATAQAVAGGAVNVHQVEVDCTENTGEDVYVAFYNSTTPTVGTTEPRMLLPGIAGTRKTYTFRRPLTAFGTAMYAAAVREKGGKGTTAPSGSVAVTVRYGV